jgi:hypothetical protein
MGLSGRRPATRTGRPRKPIALSEDREVGLISKKWRNSGIECSPRLYEFFRDVMFP